MNPEQKSKKPGIFIAIGVVAILAIVIFFAERGSSTSPVALTDTPTSAPLESTNPAADNNPPVSTKPQTSAYKDGTYTATGSYMSPGGPDQIKVTLTLANGIITDANVVAMPGDRESAHYQNLFISGCKQLVVGKSIDSVHLTVVSGSSLTSTGFNDALTQIKAHAKA